ITGLELEEFGGQGTAGSHWEARQLLGDYMNGINYSPEQVISEFTLAALEDLKFYKANYYTGGLMQFGKNKGCNFVKEKCLNNGKTNKKFKNEFFDTIRETRFTPNRLDPGCSSGRQSRVIRSVKEYEDLHEAYKYFGNKTAGCFQSADYCPVGTELNAIGYYDGSCSKGDDIFPNRFTGYVTWAEKTKDELNPFIFEKYSNKSFCVLSSLIKKEINITLRYPNGVRPLCYQMHCSEKSLTIQIGEDFIVCPREGGMVNARDFKGYLLCPDYYLICSGTVMCNDMFECVEKKSQRKEEAYYLDYESLTTQDIDDAEEKGFNSNNYELSEDGKCPKYCKNCDLNGRCKSCKADYGLVEDDEDKIICLLLSELKTGYYKDKNSIYHKCIENCLNCVDGETCILFALSLNSLSCVKKEFKELIMLSVSSIFLTSPLNG
ncbi:MAG: hypothetical protein HUJ61_00220, partial [Bacilli bacterium]|nr:hypothetical protein [Bacilli bacterium]